MGKVAVIAWGRMNPPTIGHLKLVDTVKDLAIDNNGEPFVYLSHSVDKKGENKNPLPYELKIKYAQKAFGDCVKASDAKTVIFALHEIYEQGFTDLIYVGGEDRIGGDGDITEMIEKYNGFEAKNPAMYYKFDSIRFESAGARDDNSEDLTTKASASYVRKLVLEGDHEMFLKMVPLSGEDAEDMWSDLRSIMVSKEAMFESLLNPKLQENVDPVVAVSATAYIGLMAAALVGFGRSVYQYLREPIDAAEKSGEVEVVKTDSLLAKAKAYLKQLKSELLADDIFNLSEEELANLNKVIGEVVDSKYTNGKVSLGTLTWGVLSKLKREYPEVFEKMNKKAWNKVSFEHDTALFDYVYDKTYDAHHDKFPNYERHSSPDAHRAKYNKEFKDEYGIKDLSAHPYNRNINRNIKGE